MWALSPSLFDLLSKHLIPTHMVMAEQFPAVHYTLLNTLFAHAQRYVGACLVVLCFDRKHQSSIVNNVCDMIIYFVKIVIEAINLYPTATILWVLSFCVACAS